MGRADTVINSRITELVEHLASADLTEDEICEFLTTHTFADLEPQGLFLTEVTSRKTARARASYGIDQKKFPEWQEYPLDWKLPVTDSLVEQKIVWVGSLPEWPSEYPRVSDVKFPFPVRTLVVTPILRFNNSVACFGFFSKKDIFPDEELDIFFRTIANLISLHMFRQSRDRKKLESPNVTSLTDRQVQILSYIAEKKTNNDIADIMGYSESTIRQETIRIFEKLNVAGRNEARSYFLENKDRFGISARTKGDLPSSREEFAH